ncbi:Ger(x)C family spore germination protein [Tumebacillus flagellatus]|uniref:Uncharacterized protein n=1 Tax=Tumebacillus flagellatus TaxID=1157490 RepID=A0A074MGI9_9BACL|nr:Ger(x)C family spore germination protein [Tumebacillus flagellatus]KEO84832.1 hypothetical protein EL26_02135 [Tumebacillus flagellatus]
MKIRMLGLVLLLSFGSVGCWDRVEVNDLAIVTSIGLDKTADQKIALSTELVIPAGSTSQTGPSGETQKMVVTASAATIGDAVFLLQHKLSRRIFWGQAEVLFLGENLLKTGFHDELDYILRDRETRLRIEPYACEGDARDVMLAKPRLGTELGDVMRDHSQLMFKREISINEVAQMLTRDGHVAFLPKVSAKTKEQSVPFINGGVIMKRDRMAGEVGLEEGFLIQWIRDNFKPQMITFQPKNTSAPITVQILHSTTKLTPTFEKGIPHIVIHVNADGIVMNNSTSLKESDPEVSRTLEQEAEKEIGRLMKTVIQKRQTEEKADVFGFWKAFHKKDPKSLRALQETWNEQAFPRLQVQVDANVNILNTGMISEPLKMNETR